jgi:beta propeller repeat protein
MNRGRSYSLMAIIPVLILLSLGFLLAGCSSKDTAHDSGLDGGNERKGFGDPGPHGERRISFLSKAYNGHDAFGDRVVYVGENFKPYEIDLESETEKLIDDPFFSDMPILYPHLWKDVMVFEAMLYQELTDEWIATIGVYNLALREGSLIRGPSRQERATIFENTVVWDDYRFAVEDDPDPSIRRNSEIFMYDLKTGVDARVTDIPYDQIDAEIYGDHIVWRDRRTGGYPEIYLHTISRGEEQNISNNPSLQWYPSIWGSGVVWTDLRNGTGDSVLGPYFNTDIYYYNIETEESMQITTNEFDQEGARIIGNYILWHDLRDGERGPGGYPNGCNIYMYDLQTHEEKKVTWSDRNDFGGVIAGDKVIWYSQREDTNALYMKSIQDI